MHGIRRLVRRTRRRLGLGAKPKREDLPIEVLAARLDRRVRNGDRAAATERLQLPAGRAGTPEARARARALELLATGLPPREAFREAAVIAFLSAPPPRRLTAGRGRVGTTSEAMLAAQRLRAAGHARPRIVITLPALEGNPYTDLMEQGYAAHGLAALHVDNLADAEAAIDSREAGDFEVILHVNASNRLVWGATSVEEAAAVVEHALERLDAWQADGVRLVVSIHDGPILGPIHADAERALAQGIVDRADVVHLLTASTPRLLSGWLTIDPARAVHVPHPSYDGVYPPVPPREEARRTLGLDPVDPARGGREVVVGMLGLLSARKGPHRLIQALSAVADPLPDGHRIRLLLAGRALDPDGESLIREAFTDDRIIPEFGTIAPARMSVLLGAIDVAVVPYERYLNSGWTVLALTTGIPVIGPARSTATEVVPADALITFEPADTADLARALARAPELATPAARDAARRAVADLHPREISSRFAKLLAGLPVDG